MGRLAYFWVDLRGTCVDLDILFYTSGDAEVRMKGSDKIFRVTRGERIVRGCLAKIEF
ncbi:MAG: hypothetical protein US18_C0003G0021 [Parcubacteria group bacterium GW2011_GWB1_36_5]|uniref:Uncharacterized protein n=1 Tax=Candidatus Daviesbacteria bacterium GW2011_GWA2_38_24 TaxID=1618422 RepID=A0A0G0MN54_9BACT|nr:MAG: hypothetical protein US18_C0003G0021 [Parcubacteria group bacterium GW2011_GWB1_36_5]KKQ66326.1 MAG: hypothetical protein US86_C0006G0006 [Candidatus Daviesbacteria bacterium GW2011_GWA2_38_24]